MVCKRQVFFRYSFYRPELDLETVFMLDQVQKGNGKNLSKDAVALLRKHKLVEGRANSLFLSAEVSKTIDKEAVYIKNKAFDNQYYRDLIVQYGKAQKKDFRDLLWDKLPDVLDDKAKNSKISTLLTSLKEKGIIETDSPNQQISNWVLVNKGNKSNKDN